MNHKRNTLLRTLSLSMALMLLSSIVAQTTQEIEAGPIFSNDDANNKCPVIAQQNNGTWTGQWRTTVSGQMSVCEIEFAGSSATINGFSVTRVEISDGSSIVGNFHQNNDGTWSEDSTTESNRFVFNETARDEWSVYLNDPSRGMDLQLDLFTKTVKIGGQDLYLIVNSSDAPATSGPVVQTPAPPAPIPPVSTPPTVNPGTIPDNTNSIGSSYYNEFSSTLPIWLQFSPDRGNTAPQIGTTNNLPKQTISNLEYTCTTTPYSIEQTPEELVTLDPDSNILYVGSLLQGKGYVQGIGSFAELPIRQRAPIELSIDLLSGNNKVTVENPTVQTIDSAIGELIERATNSGLRSGGAINYNKTTSSSLDEASIELGLSAKYMGASVKNKFNFSRSVDKNTVMVHFVQKMFTVRMVQPQTPGDLFSRELTPEILGSQMSLGRIGADNIPVYVDSITYGRVMTFSFTSSASEQDIANALDAAYYNKAGNGGEGNLDIKFRQVLQEAEIGLVAIGGSENSALAAIKSGDVNAYFESGTPLTSAEPISYTIRNVGDNSLAKVSDTLSYNVRECSVQQKEAPIVAEKIRITVERVQLTDDSCGNDIKGQFYLNGQQMPVPERVVDEGGSVSLSLTQDGIYKYGSNQKISISGYLLEDDNLGDDEVGKWNIEWSPVFDANGVPQAARILEGANYYQPLYGSFKDDSTPDCHSELYISITKLADIRAGNPELLGQ